MATTNEKISCSICGNENSQLKCEGCSKDFCSRHFADHHQEISKQMNEIEAICDLFRQTLTEKKSQPCTHPVMQNIDKWEHASIDKIRQTAEEARKTLLKYITENISEKTDYLKKLKEHVWQIRQENNFFETHIDQCREELHKLEKEITNSSNIILRQDSPPLVHKIDVTIKSKNYVLLHQESHI